MSTKDSFRRIALALCLTGVLAGCGYGLSLAPSQEPSVKAQSTDRRVRIYHRNTGQLDRLVGLGMDVHTVQRGRVEGFASSTVLGYATAEGLSIETLPESMMLGLPSGYHTYETLVGDLRGLAQRHPNLVTLIDAGDSWEKSQRKGDRDVWALRLTSKPNQNLPAALFTGGHHARELAPVEICWRLAKHLSEGYSSDARIRQLLDTREVWIVPMVNPDGRLAVEGGDMWWRKNRHTFARAVGVDLNRNYDAFWEKGDDSPRKETYRGESVFSEPESQAVRSLYERRRFAVAMDYHAYGNALIWPPGYSRDLSPDDARFRAIAKRMTAKNRYAADTIARQFYLAYGDVASWAYLKYGTMAFGIEMGSSFHPGFGEVDRLWEDNREPALHLIEIAADPR